MSTSISTVTACAAIALFASAPAVADNHPEHDRATVDAAEADDEDHQAAATGPAVPPAPAEVAPAILPAGPEGPALWKVADEDTTIYLFGTVHLLPKDVQWYDAEIAGALSSADTVVTELDMDPSQQAAMQQLTMQLGMYPAGTTLRTMLDEEQTAQYEAGLAALGVPAGAFDQFEPWLAGLTVTMLPLMQQGYDMESGVDKVILGRAGTTTKDALETPEFQLGLFDGLPQDNQIEFLMEAIEAIPDSKDTLDAMVAEWVEGDAAGLAELMNENLSDPDLAEALLYKRNANWADWIASRLDTPGTVFMAVGAGHLAGPRSVQDYLAERAIPTTRVQ